MLRKTVIANTPDCGVRAGEDAEAVESLSFLDVSGHHSREFEEI